MEIVEAWIRAHLPEAYRNECSGCFSEFDVCRNNIYYEERGNSELIYSGKNEEDVRLWLFKMLSEDIARKVELNNRKRNARKWRYSKIDSKSSEYKYVERRNYIYNAIEDTRLVWMELYLQFIKDVVPEEDWCEEVEKNTSRMNLWFFKPHWAYDYDNLCFKEISDSKSYRSKENPVLEPQPWEIVEVI